MVRHGSLWFETCPTRRDITAGLIKNVDTLIIGGGLAGISLLYYLVNSGMLNTYLVEEDSVGFHASGRGIGQLMFRGTHLFHEMPDGEEYLTFVAENNRRFLNGLRNFTFDHDLCDTGSVHLASNADELGRLEKEASFIYKIRGIDCPILTGSNLDLIIPSKKFIGGMFVPNEANYNPYKVVNGVRETVEKGSTRVLTNTQVESVVTNDDDSLTVLIRNRGIIRAKQIVYCTGAYTSRLLPEFENILIPFREQVIASEPLDKDKLKAIPVMNITANNCSERMRLYQSRLLVSGMRHAVRGQQEGVIYDGEMSPAVYDKLRTFTTDTFSFLKGIKFSHVWSSVFCSTPDGKPVIGPIPSKPNQYIFAGFGCFDSSNVIFGSLIIKDHLKHKDSIIPGSRILNPSRFFNV